MVVWHLPGPLRRPDQSSRNLMAFIPRRVTGQRPGGAS